MLPRMIHGILYYDSRLPAISGRTRSSRAVVSEVFREVYFRSSH